ncbi:MAG: cardiolipin synthase, partial [Marinilabiliales bacterium]
MNLLAINLQAFISFTLGAIYLFVLGFTIVKILLDTHSTSKTLSYLLVVIAFPIIGILFYFSFGINYRRKKSNQKSGDIYHKVTKELQSNIEDDTDKLVTKHKKILQHYTSLISFVRNLGQENLSVNQFKLLINGEEKFPEVLKVLDSATKHIHMEYYAWENDVRGKQIRDVLLKKAKMGVSVRVMYDAYASRKIKHNIVKELRNGGVEIHPVIKVKMAQIANRVNHRDHRKIIIVDGNIGFVGGINLSDRYDNSIDTGLYWRDTHMKITGPGVMNIQRHWIINWHACQDKRLAFNYDLLPDKLIEEKTGVTELSQINVGGPIYPMSTIMLTYAKMFSLAQKKLYITNPYFIPNETILDVLKQAA